MTAGSTVRGVVTADGDAQSEDEEVEPKEPLFVDPFVLFLLMIVVVSCCFLPEEEDELKKGMLSFMAGDRCCYVPCRDSIEDRWIVRGREGIRGGEEGGRKMRLEKTMSYRAREGQGK